MKTIKEARHEAGLSQQKMSDLLGIPKSTIEKLESMNGRKTAEK